MRRIASRSLCILLSVAAYRWYHIESCFALRPCYMRRVVGRASFLPSRHLLPLQSQVNHESLEDSCSRQSGDESPAFPPSRVMSRSAFLTLFLLSLPLSTAESVETYDELKESKDAPASKEQSSAQEISLSEKESISGFIAGATLTLTKTIVKYPMDTATVRLQMPNTKYTIRRPVELLKDSYVGITAPLLSVVPAGALFFAVKDAVQQSLKSLASSATSMDAITTLCSSRVFRTCVAVALAQIPYWIVRNPSEVVKTRKQSGLYAHDENDPALPVLPSIPRLLQSILDSSESNTTSFANGWESCYTGYWENVLYSYPADALKFVGYEQLPVLFGLDQDELNLAESAWSGAVATASAQWITTPLDVVRNRAMAQSNAKALSNSTFDLDVMNHNQTTTSSFLISYANSLWRLGHDEGLDGLFAGVTPTVIKAFISGAIQFATYEETKQAIAAFFANIGRL